MFALFLKYKEALMTVSVTQASTPQTLESQPIVSRGNLSGRSLSRKSSESCKPITGAALCLLLVVAAPYIIGGPMWYVGERDQDNGLQLAGKCFVIGGAIVEGVAAVLLGAIGNALCPCNGGPGIAH